MESQAKNARFRTRARIGNRRRHFSARVRGPAATTGPKGQRVEMDLRFGSVPRSIIIAPMHAHATQLQFP